MLLMIDNYDSFTYNVVQYLGELGAEVVVVRNDEIAVTDIAAMGPEKIVISPGPCTPNEAGLSMEVIREYAGRVPLLGICLGHQSLGQVFGGRVVRARQVMHCPPTSNTISAVSSSLNNFSTFLWIGFVGRYELSNRFIGIDQSQSNF